MAALVFRNCEKFKISSMTSSNIWCEDITARTPILVFILTFFALGYTIAHNKVVVVPLGADAGVSGFEVVTESTTITLGSLFTTLLIAYCPAGKVALGGGGSTNVLSTIVSHHSPRNDVFGSGWNVRFRNTASSSSTGSLSAYATCANTIN